MNTIFRRTILLSLLGHITVFNLFSFSFGNKIPKLDYATVNFWGAILRSSDLIPRQQPASLPPHQLPKNDCRLPPHQLGETPIGFNANWCGGYLKPAVNLVRDVSYKSENILERNVPDKMAFAKELNLKPQVSRKKEQVIMFYPHLPYHFLLYFQDRQAVHIELMFNIISNKETNSVIIKRKISSGNLEADLLTLRYIGHYLFIQQFGFPKDTWQTVKIDLSKKE